MALFTARIKNQGVFVQIEKGIIKDIEEILSSKEMLSEVGQFTVDRLKYQARLGKPANFARSTKPLESSTIRSRRYLAKHNPTHETFEESRSNLTITGQFLDSLKYVVRGTGLLEIFFDGTHKGYLSGTGKRGKSIANEKLAEYLKDIDKRFAVFDSSLNTNETFKTRIKTVVQRFIRRGLAVRNRLRA